MTRSYQDDVPNSHWLMKKKGFEESPEKQVSMMIDGINQLPAQTYFYQKDIIGLWVILNIYIYGLVYWGYLGMIMVH